METGLYVSRSRLVLVIPHLGELSLSHPISTIYRAGEAIRPTHILAPGATKLLGYLLAPLEHLRYVSPIDAA